MLKSFIIKGNTNYQVLVINKTHANSSVFAAICWPIPQICCSPWCHSKEMSGVLKLATARNPAFKKIMYSWKNPITYLSHVVIPCQFTVN